MQETKRVSGCYSTTSIKSAGRLLLHTGPNEEEDTVHTLGSGQFDRRTRTDKQMDETGQEKEIPKSRATTETHDHHTLFSFFFILFFPAKKQTTALDQERIEARKQ